MLAVHCDTVMHSLFLIIVISFLPFKQIIINSLFWRIFELYIYNLNVYFTGISSWYNWHSPECFYGSYYSHYYDPCFLLFIVDVTNDNIPVNTTIKISILNQSNVFPKSLGTRSGHNCVLYIIVWMYASDDSRHNCVWIYISNL